MTTFAGALSLHPTNIPRTQRQFGVVAVHKCGADVAQRLSLNN